MNIVIAGEGKEIHFLIKTFISQGHHVVFINNNEEQCKKFARLHEEIDVVLGDPTKPEVLEDAEIDYAHVVISLMNYDPDNLVVCQIAKEMYGVKKTFAVVNDPKNIAIFKKLGVNTVISTANIISSIIEQKVSVEDITNLISVDEGKVSVIEITINSDSPVINKTLAEISIPNSAVVGCILRSGEALIPRGNTVVLENDRLLVICLFEYQHELFKMFRGREE